MTSATERMGSGTRGVMRVAVALLGLLLASLARPMRAGQPPDRDEYEVKAVFLLKFMPFIEWPKSRFESESSPIVLAVLGDDPFHGELEKNVAGRKIGKRPVVVEHYHDLESVPRCHMLFVSREWKGPEHLLVQLAEQKSVLLVGDDEGFAERGGVINFYLLEDKMRFEINVSASKRAHLDISSKLLKLARIVEDKR